MTKYKDEYVEKYPDCVVDEIFFDADGHETEDEDKADSISLTVYRGEDRIVERTWHRSEREP